MKEVRRFDTSGFLEDGAKRMEVESEAFINQLIRYVYELPGNVSDPSFISNGLGGAFEHFYPKYANRGRALFGFEMKSSWSLYAYLTHAELAEFNEKIQALPIDYRTQFPLLKYFDDVDREGALAWFQAILKAEKGLWFWAG
ncbi:MAG: hypothetical protein AAFQ98_12480 [Bacteroidota bacterium]